MVYRRAPRWQGRGHASRHRSGCATGLGAHGLGDVGSKKDQAIVVLAVDQERPIVAVALQVGHVCGGDLDGAQGLQAEQSEQRTIAQVLHLLVVWHGTKQQRQLNLGQIAEVFGCAAIARRTDTAGRVVGAQAGGDRGDPGVDGMLGAPADPRG